LLCVCISLNYSFPYRQSWSLSDVLDWLHLASVCSSSPLAHHSAAQRARRPTPAPPAGPHSCISPSPSDPCRVSRDPHDNVHPSLTSLQILTLSIIDGVKRRALDPGNLDSLHYRIGEQFAPSRLPIASPIVTPPNHSLNSIASCPTHTQPLTCSTARSLPLPRRRPRRGRSTISAPPPHSSTTPM
jgi:hypothetical protein